MATISEASAAVNEVKLAWDPVWGGLSKKNQILPAELSVKARDVEAQVNNFFRESTTLISTAAVAAGTPSAIVYQLQLGSVITNAARMKALVQELRVQLKQAGISDEDMVPPTETSVWTLVKIGLVVGTGYLLYRWGKDIFSEDYPRHKLPRYAGGSR